jgi:hypothetical protein
MLNLIIFTASFSRKEEIEKKLGKTSDRDYLQTQLKANYKRKTDATVSIVSKKLKRKNKIKRKRNKKYL